MVNPLVRVVIATWPATATVVLTTLFPACRCRSSVWKKLVVEYVGLLYSGSFF